MSKIMRALYAEARAAREAAARITDRPSGAAPVTPSTPNPTKALSIEWWLAQYERAGRALASGAADSATRALRGLGTREEHLE